MAGEIKVSELNRTYKNKLHKATLHLGAAINHLTSGALREIFGEEIKKLEEAEESINRKIMEAGSA